MSNPIYKDLPPVERKDAESETTQESQMIEIMNKAVEISKENQRQERVTNWLSGGVVVIVAIYHFIILIMMRRTAKNISKL